MKQTIQRTGKQYKAMTAIGWLLIISSPILFLNHHGALSAAALMAGVFIKIIASIGAWWSNG
jgi:hypothetical protein